MWEALFDVVVPVFAVAGVGFLYARAKGFPLSEMTDLIIHVTGACLVFDALVASPRLSLGSLRAPLSAALLVGGGILLAALARAAVPRLRALSFASVALPVSFMNAGNLGLPLADLALGPRGFEVALLFFVTFSALQYSVGIAIARGPGGALEVLRLPLLYAAGLGVVVNQLALELPKTIMVPIGLLGQTVIPLMLLSLGASLAKLLRRAEQLPDAEEKAAEPPPRWAVLALPLLRMVGGIGGALLINAALGNQGAMAQVTILVGAMPPAVMNFALIEKYRRRPEETALVSAAIAVGTLLSLVITPLVVRGIGAA